MELVKMQRAARKLDKLFNGSAKGQDRQVGFALIAFDLNAEGGDCRYIGNVDRESVKQLWLQQIAHFDARAESAGEA